MHTVQLQNGTTHRLILLVSDRKPVTKKLQDYNDTKYVSFLYPHPSQELHLTCVNNSSYNRLIVSFLTFYLYDYF